MNTEYLDLDSDLAIKIEASQDGTVLCDAHMKGNTFLLNVGGIQHSSLVCFELSW